jgi:hypothetical protein
MGYLNSLLYSSIERTSVAGIYTKPIGIYNPSLAKRQDHLTKLSRYHNTTTSLVNNLVLLAMHSLDILARKDGVVVNDVLLRTDVRLGVSVKLLGLGCEVEVDGVGPCESD